MPKFIAYDFNGVLDIDNAFEIRTQKINEPLIFQIKAIIDLNKAAHLFRFLIANPNIKAFCISEYSKYENISHLLINAFKHTENEEFKDIKEYVCNNRKLIKTQFVSPYKKGKHEAICSIKEQFKDSDIIALEDEKDLSSYCKQIWINGLNESHILKINEIWNL